MKFNFYWCRVSNRVLPFLVGRLHTKSEINHMIPSADMLQKPKFLFLVTTCITFDHFLHDSKYIGFFISLLVGFILSLKLIMIPS